MSGHESGDWALWDQDCEGWGVYQTQPLPRTCLTRPADIGVLEGSPWPVLFRQVKTENRALWQDYHGLSTVKRERTGHRPNSIPLNETESSTDSSPYHPGEVLLAWPGLSWGLGGLEADTTVYRPAQLLTTACSTSGSQVYREVFPHFDHFYWKRTWLYPLNRLRKRDMGEFPQENPG